MPSSQMRTGPRSGLHECVNRKVKLGERREWRMRCRKTSSQRAIQGTCWQKGKRPEGESICASFARTQIQNSFEAGAEEVERMAEPVGEYRINSGVSTNGRRKGGSPYGGVLDVEDHG